MLKAKSKNSICEGSIAEKPTGYEEIKDKKVDFKGKLKLATLEDLEAIMDINDDVYEGLDYVPGSFHYFLQSKAHKLYLIEEDGKLVSMVNYRFLPDQKDVVVSMSGRVRQGYQGRGYNVSFSGPIIQQLRRDHPEVKRLIGCSQFNQRIKENIDKWEVVYIDNFILYKITDRPRLLSFLGHAQKSKEFNPPINISYSKGIEWITNSDQLIRFLSKYTEYIMCFTAWMPVRINQTGLRLVMQNMIVFATFGESTVSVDKTSPKTEFLEMASGKHFEGELIGFSYSCCLQCKYGICVDINFFGDDVDVYISHLIKHLNHYASTVKEDVKIGCYLHFPKTISVNTVEEKLREGLGSRVKNDYYCVTEVVQYFLNLPTSKL